MQKIVYKPLLKKTALYLTKYANGKGGTSNDGNQAGRFFSQKYGEFIVGCVGDKYKNAIRQLHLNLSIILRVVSSTGILQVVSSTGIMKNLKFLINKPVF